MSSAEKDFNKSTITALRKKNIKVIGSTWLPDENGCFLNGERGYKIDDNGTGKIWRFLEVLNISRQ